MTAKKLVVFGCSWTYGDELVDPTIEISNTITGTGTHDQQNDAYRLQHCFAGVVAKHYNLELENYGFPGSSEESLRYTFNWWLDNTDTSDSVILVAHTDASRKSWYNYRQQDPEWNKFMHSTWIKDPNPDIDEHWYQLQKLWLGMSYHRDWAHHNLRETAQLFDWASSRLNIPVLQVNALKNPTVKNIATFCESDYSLQQLLQAEKNPALFAKQGHPTVTGHEIISKHLISLIDSSKLLG